MNRMAKHRLSAVLAMLAFWFGVTVGFAISARLGRTQVRT